MALKVKSFKFPIGVGTIYNMEIIKNELKESRP
jgi:hypothetical protein